MLQRVINERSYSGAGKPTNHLKNVSTRSRFTTWSLGVYDDPTCYSDVDFKVFIDLDPDTGGPKPWQSEASLKEFKVIFTAILRPDLEENENDEVYPGEGREI
ncbi:MAG: hypothetical protein J3Q66DRAFT_372939 [Benniella sp.]|nr:MAG: hypothetical protein J3Q66DRAFT_372939 [Benniella sp.]